jgi:hypothetical protein
MPSNINQVEEKHMPPELPLFISTKEKTTAQYDSVVQQEKMTLNKIYAPMGGFVVANAPNNIAILHTASAASCTIMIVHMGRGVGALGHYYAQGNIRKEAGGIVQMVEACNAATNTPNASPVSIAIGAGSFGDFQDRLLSAIKSLYPTSFCTHVGGDNYNNQVYSAAVYIPLRYRAAFFDHRMNSFFDGVKNWHVGLSEHGYDLRDASII